MAQSQDQQDPVQLMPQDESEALAMLQNELQSQAQTFAQEAAERMPVAMQMANNLKANNDLNGTLLAAVESAPRSRVITNETLARDKDIMRIAKGAGFVAQGAVAVRQDPESGEVIISSAPATRQSDNKVIQTVLDTQSRRADAPFNLTDALNKTKLLRGDDMLDHISSTMVNIDVQLSKEMQRIREAAAIESGYSAAHASLDRNIQLDESTGFTARFGQASGQTQMARQQMTAALSASQALERSLTAADSRVAELLSAKNTLARIESRRGAREARADEKREAVAELVTPVELANYRIIFGTSGDDTTDKATIATRRDKDKVMGKLIQAGPDNIHNYLMDPDPKVKNGALKLVVEYEKAINADIPKDATETPTSKLLKSVINNPAALIKLIPDKERRKEVETQIRMAKSGKDVAEIKSNVLPELLGLFIEQQTESKWQRDMSKWKSPNINDESSLSKTIKQIKQTTPDGTAPMRLVYDSFIESKIAGPDGKPLPFPEKVKILEDNIRGSVSALDKSLLVSQDALDAMRMRNINDMKIVAARAFMRSQVYTSEQRIEGMEFLYSKEYKRPAK